MVFPWFSQLNSKNPAPVGTAQGHQSEGCTYWPPRECPVMTICFTSNPRPPGHRSGIPMWDPLSSKSAWWFFALPPWKMMEFVRLDHHPSYWGKMKKVPNHQPVNLCKSGIFSWIIGPIGRIGHLWVNIFWREQVTHHITPLSFTGPGMYPFNCRYILGPHSVSMLDSSEGFYWSLLLRAKVAIEQHHLVHIAPAVPVWSSVFRQVRQDLAIPLPLGWLLIVFPWKDVKKCHKSRSPHLRQAMTKRNGSLTTTPMCDCQRVKRCLSPTGNRAELGPCSTPKLGFIVSTLVTCPPWWSKMFSVPWWFLLLTCG